MGLGQSVIIYWHHLLSAYLLPSHSFFSVKQKKDHPCICEVNNPVVERRFVFQHFRSNLQYCKISMISLHYHHKFNVQNVTLQWEQKTTVTGPSRVLLKFCITVESRAFQNNLALTTKITPHLQLVRFFNSSSYTKTNPMLCYALCFSHVSDCNLLTVLAIILNLFRIST